MVQFYFKDLEPAIKKMEEKVAENCICTLTKGDETDYKFAHYKDAVFKKKGYILSVVYPDGQAALEDDPVWEGWTVGKPSRNVCLEGGQLKWLRHWF